MTRLILASASRPRRDLLRAAGVVFAVDPAAIDEARLTQTLRAEGKTAETIAARLAEEKALTVLSRHPADIVLGADSVLALPSNSEAVGHKSLPSSSEAIGHKNFPSRSEAAGHVATGERLIGKSPDFVALKALLRELSGRSHDLTSAVALAKDGRVIWRCAVTSRLTMRPLSDPFLDAYLAEGGDALLSAVGGYHFEGLGAQLFDAVEGDYFSILGLPLLPVLKELRNLGLLPA